MKTIAINPRQNKEQTRAFVTECPLHEYDALIHSGQLTQLAWRITNTNDDEQQKRLKGYLPFRCPHYSRFRDNYRDRSHIVAEAFTWQTCIDIDDMTKVEGARMRALELNEEPCGMWQGMLLHMDYSARKKLHIDIRLPLGMTVPEAQRSYCQALGVPEACDTSCFTPERFIYITPAEYEIFRAEGWYEQLPDEEVRRRRQAYLDRGLTIDGRTESGSYFDPIEPSATPTKTSVNAPANNGQSSMVNGQCSLEFRGIPYSHIIKEYWLRTGGEPCEGERNVKLHKLAANLRSICDNKTEVLMQVMPRFGLTDAELKTIVDSACKEQPKGISKIMQSIISGEELRVKDEGLDEEDTQKNSQLSTINAQLSENLLPIGLKESLIGVPENMHMPVLCSVMPIAATYADQVEVEYCDGERMKLGLMSIIHGEQASGKSVCKRAVNIWKRQFDKEDELARQREDAWTEHKKSRKANEKLPDNPKVLIRVVPVTISCSTLLKRLKYAQGHTLFSFCEELDTLRKTNSAGNWSAKYDIYRLAFDSLDSEWGQDYNSDQAESGVVKVAYNWTMLGTNGAVRKCFKGDNIENGLSSRILLAEMPDSAFAKIPKYGRRSAEDEERIQEAVTRLRSYSGFVDTPRLREAIDQWLEEKRVEALKNIDLVMDTYRRRAAVIGFRCGVIHHLLSQESGNFQEGDSSIEFAVMMAEYCLQQQMKTFGEALANAYVDARSECQRYGVNDSIFDQLANTFTMADLRALKQGLCGESALRTIISRWRQDGWIEKTDSKHWRKMSLCHNVTTSH